MKKFRIALSGDFRKPDGSLAFPMFDLSKLECEPDVEWEYVDPVNGRMEAASSRAAGRARPRGQWSAPLGRAALWERRLVRLAAAAGASAAAKGALSCCC